MLPLFPHEFTLFGLGSTKPKSTCHSHWPSICFGRFCPSPFTFLPPSIPSQLGLTSRFLSSSFLMPIPNTCIVYIRKYTMDRLPTSIRVTERTKANRHITFTYKLASFHPVLFVSLVSSVAQFLVYLTFNTLRFVLKCSRFFFYFWIVLCCLLNSRREICKSKPSS